MKIKTISILIGICAALAFTSCTTSQVESALPEITLAASGGTAIALYEIKANSSTRGDVYNIATACYSLATGNAVPSAAELQNAIGSYVTDPVASEIGQLVVALYNQYCPQLNGNGKVAADLLGAIAKGVQLGAGAPTPAAALAAKPYRLAILAKLHQIHNRK